MTRLIAFIFVVGITAPCAAQIHIGPEDDFESALNGLSPGDEVVLADGIYRLTTMFNLTAIGTPGNEVVIRAADGATPHFYRPNDDENVWNIASAQNLVIRGLSFSGGDRGIRVQAATNLTIEDCHIFGTEGPALTMNQVGATYAQVEILRNHIHDTGGSGEALYLGCNAAMCTVSGALIDGNHIHHTNGADVTQGEGIQLSPGSSDVSILDNVIHDTGYACIVGHDTRGNGAPNTVEGNVMWGCGFEGIRWSADATIRNNIVLGSGSDGIAATTLDAVAPAELIISHNTVLAASNDALTIRDADGSVLAANNALYSMSGRAFFVLGSTATITSSGNVGSGAVAGIGGISATGSIATDFVSANFSGSVPNDVFPAAGGALIAAGDVTHVANVDFNGSSRMAVPDVGAYAFDLSGNPGWTIGATPKPPTAPPVDMQDGGVPMDAGIDGGAPVEGETCGGETCSVNGAAGSRAGSFGSWALLVALSMLILLRRRRART